MTTQLLLIDDSDRDWKLDPQTRELGLRGIAQARAVLHSVPHRVETTVDDDAEPARHPRRRRPIAA